MDYSNRKSTGAGKKKKRKKKNNVSIPNATQRQQPKQQNLSLSSRLKRERGTAASTPFPPEWSGTSSSPVPKFLTEKDGERWESCVKECYRGFSYEKPSDLPSQLHSAFASTFDAMDDAGLFLYDVVQPGGKRLSLTFVTRTLIGDPGSTYKYLGLRLFSHPWCDVDDRGDGQVKSDGALDGHLSKKNKLFGKSLIKLGYSRSCANSLISMGSINQHLVRRTNDVLQKEISPLVEDSLVGSAEYSLTLINKMEPSTLKKDLKNDNIHGIGKTSVSWHKDSGLQDFSSIAVYHTLKDLKNVDNDDINRKSVPWKVALRVADAKSRTPALSIPLPSGALYYLLDDFNHQHEHAVISGSESLRYSSTHRVARDGCGSWQYIRDKCENVLSSNLCSSVLSSVGNPDEAFVHYNNSLKRKALVKEFRACQQLATEVEFEWVRQWHIQGGRHAELHRYWHGPMDSLSESFSKLYRVISGVSDILRKASNVASEDLFDVAIEAAEHRERLLSAWGQRLKDPIFSTLLPDERPLDCEAVDVVNASFCTAEELRKWRGAFMSLKEEKSDESKGNGSKKRKLKKDKTSCMTKKEKRRIASNWEKMKKKM